MKIYNTLTKRKEEFVPVEPGKVKMYVCGPNVYNFIHIGNARPMIVFDTVRRYFEYKGYDVNYVSNLTDVDEKIIKKESYLTQIGYSAGVYGCNGMLLKGHNTRTYYAVTSRTLAIYLFG